MGIGKWAYFYVPNQGRAVTLLNPQIILFPMPHAHLKKGIVSLLTVYTAIAQTQFR